MLISRNRPLRQQNLPVIEAYPDYLSWHLLAKLVAIDSEVTDAEGNLYLVKERLVSSTPGALPRVRLEKVLEMQVTDVRK